MGHEVYRATDFDVLPLNPNISVINPPHPVESHLIALVRSHWHGGHFLFSYEWDITRRLQAQWFAREEDATKAIWETVRLVCPLGYRRAETGCRRTTVSFGIGGLCIARS